MATDPVQYPHLTIGSNVLELKLLQSDIIDLAKQGVDLFAPWPRRLSGAWCEAILRIVAQLSRGSVSYAELAAQELDLQFLNEADLAIAEAVKKAAARTPAQPQAAADQTPNTTVQ